MKSESRRLTFLLVPEGGQGEVRQLSLSRSHLLRAMVISGLLLLLLLSAFILMIWSLPKALQMRRVQQENDRLREQVVEVRQRLDALKESTRKIQAWEQRLRELEASGGLPGMGPTDEVQLAKPSEEGLFLMEELNQVEEGLDRVDGSYLELALDVLHASRSVLPQLWPVEGVVTSGFGWRASPFTGEWTLHGGVDIGAPLGEPILATNRGKVLFSGWDGGHGQMVVLDHGGGVLSRYSHASVLLVDPGDRVEEGEVLALVGNTGMSTGPHLHYDLIVDGERVDPLDYLP